VTLLTETVSTLGRGEERVREGWGRAAAGNLQDRFAGFQQLSTSLLTSPRMARTLKIFSFVSQQHKILVHQLELV